MSSVGFDSVIAMSNGPELRGTINGLNVTLLQRWSSAWADLQAAGMALYERKQLDDTKASNLFLRRALWESAIASYGRCAVSDQGRKIPFKEFVEEITGDEGLAVHEQIMDWRHGHVAHRKRSEFESVETVLTFASGPSHPTSLNVVLNIHSGPDNKAELVVAFDAHVTALRDAMWEKRMFPLAPSIVDDLNAGRIARPNRLRAAKDDTSAGRYVINQCISTLGAGGPIRDGR